MRPVALKNGARLTRNRAAPFHVRVGQRGHKGRARRQRRVLELDIERGLLQRRGPLVDDEQGGRQAAVVQRVQRGHVPDEDGDERQRWRRDEAGREQRAR